MVNHIFFFVSLFSDYLENNKRFCFDWIHRKTCNIQRLLVDIPTAILTTTSVQHKVNENDIFFKITRCIKLKLIKMSLIILWNDCTMDIILTD